MRATAVRPSPVLMAVLCLSLLASATASDAAPGHPGKTSVFISELRQLLLPDRFLTDDGHEVRVTAETLLVGFFELAELQPGDMVRVTVSGHDAEQPWLVLAAVVELRQGEDPGGGTGADGGGLRSTEVGTLSGLLPPSRFILDGSLEVVTTPDTVWLGTLSSYADLAENQVVSVELSFAAETNAATVTGLGNRGSEGLTYADTTPGGTVTAVVGNGDRLTLILDSGDEIVADSLTVVTGIADSLDEITVGMAVSADVAMLSRGVYLAMAIEVASPIPWSTPGHSAAGFTEALVILGDDADPEAVAAAHGATLSGALPGRLVHLFRWSEPVSSQEAESLLAEPSVEDVEPNYAFEDPEAVRRRRIVVDRRPSSSKYLEQAAVSAAAIAEAHQRSVGAGTVVAVLDTGVDILHPLLRHRVAPGGWDFVDDDSTPWETSDGIDNDGDGEIDESAGHGTFVAGLVLLAAPGTAILPYRVLDDDGHGSSFDICLAVLDAMSQGADVINMSFAYDERVRVLDRLLMEASQRGIVLVSGAGNTGSAELPFPASDSRVIAVAAVDGVGILADFSNHGEAVTIAAPGVGLYSGGMDQELGTWGGTSMAAPLVSGAVALLRSINPQLTPTQIEAALAQSAVPLADSAPVRRPGGRIAGKACGPAAGKAEGEEQRFGLLQVSAALDLVPTAE